MRLEKVPDPVDPDPLPYSYMYPDPELEKVLYPAVPDIRTQNTGFSFSRRQLLLYITSSGKISTGTFDKSFVFFKSLIRKYLLMLNSSLLSLRSRNNSNNKYKIRRKRTKLASFQSIEETLDVIVSPGQK